MKNIYVKSVTVLFTICLTVAVLLALVNSFTAPVITEAQKKAETASLAEVLPEATDFEKLSLADGTPETVSGIYKDKGGSGYAVLLATSSQYSNGDMLISVGIDSDGTIKGIKLMAYTESKDFGADYPDSFIGKDSALSGVDTVAGVTYSSSAFINAVRDAFTGLSALGVDFKEAE